MTDDVFAVVPAEPLTALRQWFEGAVAAGVREPGVLALATAGSDGRSASRMVQTLRLDADGLLFTSHAGSVKGRHIAETGWASGVLYWRENGRQITLAGRVTRLPDADSDALWAARPAATHPMSVASEQSAPLDDEAALRAAARRLADQGAPLTRPAQWCGYRLTPSTVEFWEADADRLHRRLRYDRTGDGWLGRRLQP
ncbi:phenazine biosynthesis FMN-dependent oxidase PhzG [Dactylosporangium sp. NPDC048998]|uniref:phenazine biosynthesis FMN-dependent oxidase PhzG n=1 Tax=Dactylosporangium sp. NPDC048998 TaxID=3363976 RepID=UPI003710F223